MRPPPVENRYCDGVEDLIEMTPENPPWFLRAAVTKEGVILVPRKAKQLNTNPGQTILQKTVV
jgi:hypothetical protein